MRSGLGGGEVFTKPTPMHAHANAATTSGGGKTKEDSESTSWSQWLSQEYVRLMPLNWPMKAAMTVITTWLLSKAVIGSPGVKMADQDVIVYCGIYSSWAVYYLPDVLLHLSPCVVGKIFWLSLRLFFAEVVICSYLHFAKGERRVLERGLSMRPMLPRDYQWMEDMAHNIRFVLIVGCLSASLVAHLFDRPEILIDYVEEDLEDEGDNKDE